MVGPVAFVGLSKIREARCSAVCRSPTGATRPKCGVAVVESARAARSVCSSSIQELKESSTFSW